MRVTCVNTGNISLEISIAHIFVNKEHSAEPLIILSGGINTVAQETDQIWVAEL